MKRDIDVKVKTYVGNLEALVVYEFHYFFSTGTAVLAGLSLPNGVIIEPITQFDCLADAEQEMLCKADFNARMSAQLHAVFA